MALISLQEISLAFNGPLIFDCLSLQLEPGERIALLGRNGAGKTTLIRILTTLLKPTSGSAVVACCMVLGKDSSAVLGHLDSETIKEVVAGPAFTELRDAHKEGRFGDISYCKDCDQLYNLPNSLVWSNIPGRDYGQSKIVDGLDHRRFAENIG